MFNTAKIKKIEHPGGDEYTFYCNNCNRKVSMGTWEKSHRCICGTVWKVKDTRTAYQGTKDVGHVW